MRILELTLEEAIDVCKALANEQRMKILEIISSGPLNVNDISEIMKQPFSTTAVNVKKLEDAGLISTHFVPGRGTQKISSSLYDRIVIDLMRPDPTEENIIILDMPVGEYVDCRVEPSCGLVSENGFLGIHDDPRSFYEPDRKLAQKLFFSRAGYVEYRFPNRLPYGCTPQTLEFSAEMCSEAPHYRLDWPSDITVWINNIEIGTWTSPGDFGGKRGFLTPSWVTINSSQYGLLKYWTVNAQGSFIDGIQVSNVTIDQLNLTQLPFISVKIGVKDDAANQGGLNLFGKRFGNYDQDLILKLGYSTHSKANS